MTITVANLGFPRIGAKRELKSALESFWAGQSGPAALLRTAAGLRAAHWRWQRELGAEVIPSNDFSLYDQVLDTACMVGAIPDGYGWRGGLVGLETYFALARGGRAHEPHCGCGAAGDAPALEMTKWLDTNYHYLVPVFAEDQTFRFSDLKPVNEYREALAQGIETRPVLLGPVSFLKLGKARGFDPVTLLPRLLPVYAAVLHALAAAGADWVQIDEPCLVTDLDAAARAALRAAYAALGQAPVKLMLTTYFGALGDNLPLALSLPVQGLHIDLARAPEQLDAVLAAARPDLLLSLGVIDGRNVWRADLAALLDRLEPLARERDIMLAPSCSLLHVPLDLARESGLDDEIKSWLAFAAQKIGELAILARALREGRGAVAGILRDSSIAAARRRISPRIFDPAVRERLRAAPAEIDRRGAAYAERALLQRQTLQLPLFPTTTIGSFPQTAAVRHARAQFGQGASSRAAYEEFLRAETARAVAWQEEAGLDVLVHGEFERNDMVQYFGERLSGFAFTRHAWVQSYGSRCVRPPIIYGDVARPAPITLDWWRYAQALTTRPMKAMLTGPVTILNWSFVRDDQPREQTCRQIALAMRDEVADLEAAGARIIQIDEAALREGLPLRQADAASYLDWAVECFRVTAAGARPATQIHTHMCYSEFNGIMAAIAAMDADVISIETARSNMELLEAFAAFDYPAQIGPGVYDIHSPRVPGAAAIVALLAAAARHLPAERLWVNPDCGLKTRGWAEVKPSIAAMVAAAREARARLAPTPLSQPR